MKKRCAAFLAVMILAVSLGACQGTDAGTSARGADAGEALPDAGGEGKRDAAEEELYSLYIDVNNYMIERIADSLSRYFYHVNLAEEFSLAEREKYDCYSLSQYRLEKADKAYEAACAKSGKSELDQAFLEMYPSYKTVTETLQRIYEYTDMKSYMDDDYEKGREYHAVLMGALGEYFTSSDAFMDALGAVARERQIEDLKRLNEEGYEVLYAINAVIDLAKDIEEELAGENVWDNNALEMDLGKIQPLYDEFTAQAEIVLEYSKDEEKLEGEGIPSQSGAWSGFLNAMKDTKASLAEVLHKVKTGEPLNEIEIKMSSIPGGASLSSFDTGLSNMISEYNRLK